MKNQPKAAKPISLSPLKFEEAVSDLLKVKPEPKKSKQPKRKKTPHKRMICPHQRP